MKPTIYIRESCEHQNATEPEDFINMGMAYMWLVWVMVTETNRPCVTQSMLESLIDLIRGRRIDFRQHSVVFANGTSGAPHDDISRQLTELLKTQHGGDSQISPEAFYQRLMEIHPWDDGNGRVGSLIFNYLTSHLQYPKHPPEFGTINVHGY